MAGEPSHGEAVNVLAEAEALLRFQGELGLTSLELEESRLEFPPAEAPAVEASPVERSPVPVVEAVSRALDTTPLTGVASRDALQGMQLTNTPLDDIIREIGPCERCELHRRRTHIVFGVGNPSARLMFVGEGPGRDEDLQAEPFVGKAGNLLDRMIVAMGRSREQGYIANIVKSRPPRNRDPEPQEVEACEGFLRKQIAVIQPEVIVALGRYAAQTLLRDSTPISRMRGGWREYQGIPLMPTFHPAYLLRNPGGKKPTWADLQEVMKRLELKPPGR